MADSPASSDDEEAGSGRIEQLKDRYTGLKAQALERLAMLRGAFGTEQGAEILRDFFGTAMLSRVAPRIGGDDDELRVSLAVSHLIGVAVLRYVIGFPSLRDVPVDRLIEAISPRVQSYFDD